MYDRVEVRQPAEGAPAGGGPLVARMTMHTASYHVQQSALFPNTVGFTLHPPLPSPPSCAPIPAFTAPLCSMTPCHVPEHVVFVPPQVPHSTRMRNEGMHANTYTDTSTCMRVHTRCRTHDPVSPLIGASLACRRRACIAVGSLCPQAFKSRWLY